MLKVVVLICLRTAFSAEVENFQQDRALHHYSGNVCHLAFSERTLDGEWSSNQVASENSKFIPPLTSADGAYHKCTEQLTNLDAF